MSDLRVLRLTDYDSYIPPFQVQAVADIFVDDLRSDDDESLNLVPRITTFNQLKDIFKLDVDHSLGRDATPEGGLYWALIGFYIRTGIAAFIPRVSGEDGQALPPPGAFVFAHWPGAPEINPTPNPNYHNNAVGGFTNVNGDIGFGYSGGAVVGGDGGVYTIWVSADPPNGTRFFSDAAIKLGWFGGTDHLTPNPIFQAVRKADTQPPPPPPVGNEAKLVVFDKAGLKVGETLLQVEGTGGRIALFINGEEQSFAELK